MKTMTIIVPIGTNGMLKDDGYPLHDSEEYSQYWRKVTHQHVIVLSQRWYDLLADKAPPFPCRDVIVIGTGLADSKNTRTSFAPDLHTLFATIDQFDVEKKVFCIVDNDTTVLLLEQYSERVQSLEVAQFQKEFSGEKSSVTLSSLSWRVIERSFPDCTIHSYFHSEAIE